MKRDVFSELSEGFDALAQARQGKLTLRSHKVQLAELMAVSAEELVAI
ncbi:transcriptional regulator, partial [Pseudomonas frederiksbergensis]|nr:transcriptional regulator [Pseudomonas frederiksbergensis]